MLSAMVESVAVTGFLYRFHSTSYSMFLRMPPPVVRVFNCAEMLEREDGPIV
jgi:hypothetical protein